MHRELTTWSFRIAAGIALYTTGCEADPLDMRGASGASSIEAVATQSQALVYAGPPIISTTFTKPLPTFDANGTRLKPGTGADDIAIRALVESLVLFSKDVASATDLYIAAYDWDQFWNTSSFGAVTWPDLTCGAGCCGSSSVCCSDAGCPSTCNNADGAVQNALDRNLEIKTIFNKRKGKPAVQKWLTDAIAAKKLRQSGGSYEGVTVCDRGNPLCSAKEGGSCLGDNDMHAKMLLVRRWQSLFVPTPDYDYTSFVTSGNFDYDQLLNWNDAVSVVNDKKLYEGLARYYDKMAQAKSWSKTAAPYYPESSTVLGFNQVDGDLGIVRAYLFPRNERMLNSSEGDNDERTIDVVWRVLDNVETGSTIAIVQDQLNGDNEDGRGALLDKLIELANERGVDVRLIVSDDQYAGDVKTKLDTLRASANGLVYKIKAMPNYGGAGLNGVSIHHKFFLTSGEYNGGVFQRLVFMGSQNWTASGLTRNDEIMLKIKECQTAPCLHAYDTPGSPFTGSYANNEIWLRYAEHWNALCAHVVKLDGTKPASDACLLDESLTDIY